MEPLKADALYTQCDLSMFDFETTDDIEAQLPLVGQDRRLSVQFFAILD